MVSIYDPHLLYSTRKNYHYLFLWRRGKLVWYLANFHNVLDSTVTYVRLVYTIHHVVNEGMLHDTHFWGILVLYNLYINIKRLTFSYPYHFISNLVSGIAQSGFVIWTKRPLKIKLHSIDRLHSYIVKSNCNNFFF